MLIDHDDAMILFTFVLGGAFIFAAGLIGLIAARVSALKNHNHISEQNAFAYFKASIFTILLHTLVAVIVYSTFDILPYKTRLQLKDIIFYVWMGSIIATWFAISYVLKRQIGSRVERTLR